MVAEMSVVTTDAEKEVLLLTAQTWEKYLKLPAQMPDESREVQKSIHTIQQMIALRLARRADPEVWGPE